MNVDFRDMRVKLMIVIGVLLVIDLAAVALLLSPAGRSRGARQQTYEELRHDRIEMTKAALPVQGMDQKIATAHQQEDDFNKERVAEHYSTISEQLSQTAREAGVRVSDVTYDTKEQKDLLKGYDNIGITILVGGTYEQNMRFINAIERQKLMLLIDAVSFGGMKGDEMRVTIHLSTFLRSAV